MSNSNINADQELDDNTKQKFDDILSKCDEYKMNRHLYKNWNKIYQKFITEPIGNKTYFLHNNEFCDDFYYQIKPLVINKYNFNPYISLQAIKCFDKTGYDASMADRYLKKLNTNLSVQDIENIYHKSRKYISTMLSTIKEFNNYASIPNPNGPNEIVSLTNKNDQQSLREFYFKTIRVFMPINEFSNFIKNEDVKTRIKNMSFEELYQLNKYQIQKFNFNEAMFKFSSTIALTTDKKKMIKFEYYGAPIFKLEVERRTKTQVGEVVDPAVTKTETYDGIENIRKYFDNNLFIENGKEIFIKKASFKDLYRAFCDDEEEYKSVNPLSHIQQNKNNIIHMLEEDKDPVYQSIQKHKKIQKQFKNYEQTKQEQKQRQQKLEQECFKDCQNITDKVRKTKKYKDKIRSFEVKKYLNIMYRQNKLYKYDEEKNKNMSKKEFDKQFNNKNTYNKNHHDFCNAPEKTTLHSTKILNQKDVNKHLS